MKSLLVVLVANTDFRTANEVDEIAGGGLECEQTQYGLSLNCGGRYFPSLLSACRTVQNGYTQTDR